MGDEIVFENGRISDFQGLVTLTLDRVILHTVIHHSSTSTYVPNFVEIKETVWTDEPTDGHLRPTLLGPLGGVELITYYSHFFSKNFNMMCITVNVNHASCITPAVWHYNSNHPLSVTVSVKCPCRADTGNNFSIMVTPSTMIMPHTEW